MILSAISFIWFTSVLGFPQVSVSERDVLSTLDLERSTITFDVKDGARNSKPLNHQLIGMSIEFCYIVDFIGDLNSPNLFSRQLLQNVEDRSGYLPILRVGGNTQDLAKYCENCPQTMNSTFKPGKSEALNVTYSKALFEAMNENLAPHQEYIFGLNLGQDDIRIPTAELNGALKYLNQSNVIAYELGNEPDHYNNVGNNWTTKAPIRPPYWGVLDYAATMIEWIPKLHARTSRSFAGFQFASISTNPVIAKDFTLVQLAKLKVPQRAGHVKILSSHSYMGNICSPEAAALVDLENYVNHLNTVRFYSAFESEIATAKSLGMEFHMGETNSAACHGKDGVSNTMGALLWEIDYSLYGATLGMDRLFFHNGKGDFFYSMWEPVALNASFPAHINPTYFSMLFVAEVVSGLQSPRIYRVSHLDTYNMAHYAIYERNKLRKFVILNTHYYNISTGARPVKTIDISPVLKGKTKAIRLTAPLTTSKNGTIFEGQSVDSSGKMTGEKVTELLQDGEIKIAASQAVIIESV